MYNMYSPSKTSLIFIKHAHDLQVSSSTQINSPIILGGLTVITSKRVIISLGSFSVSSCFRHLALWCRSCLHFQDSPSVPFAFTFAFWLIAVVFPCFLVSWLAFHFLLPPCARALRLFFLFSQAQDFVGGSCSNTDLKNLRK